MNLREAETILLHFIRGLDDGQICTLAKLVQGRSPYDVVKSLFSGLKLPSGIRAMVGAIEIPVGYVPELELDTLRDGACATGSMSYTSTRWRMHHDDMGCFFVHGVRHVSHFYPADNQRGCKVEVHAPYPLTQHALSQIVLIHNRQIDSSNPKAWELKLPAILPPPCT